MPLDTIIKISGTILANATTNGIASIDIPEDGEIMCIGGLIMGIFQPAPNSYANTGIRVAGELSFNSTNQIGINDSRGAIAGIGAAGTMMFSEAAETGGGGCKISEQNSLCIEGGITINAGERIFIHGFSNDVDLTGTLTFLLYIKTRGGGRRAAKRR